MVDHISRILMAVPGVDAWGPRRQIVDSALALRLHVGRLSAIEREARAYLAARDRSDPTGEAEARRLLDAALAGGGDS